PQALRRSVERSLRRLRTDRIDMVFLHCGRAVPDVEAQRQGAETLLALRDEGLIRAAGMSVCTTAGGFAALEWADVLMVEYHLEDDSMTDVMKAARAAGIGVVVKKGLASG